MIEPSKADMSTGAEKGSTGMNTDLISIFTENGYTLDTEIIKGKRFYTNEKFLSTFAAHPFKALLDFGFLDKSTQMSQSLMFLHGISAFFIEKLSKNPDIEIVRTTSPLANDEKSVLLQKAPYAIGFEHITESWLECIWGNLTKAFEEDLSGFDGSAAHYLLSKNNQINVAGKVFFHLVENKNSIEYPFRFGIRKRPRQF